MRYPKAQNYNGFTEPTTERKKIDWMVTSDAVNQEQNGGCPLPGCPPCAALPIHRTGADGSAMRDVKAFGSTPHMSMSLAYFVIFLEPHHCYPFKCYITDIFLRWGMAQACKLAGAPCVVQEPDELTIRYYG
ncbi:hypothetical protein NC652_017807 [Populus alba x Populus x berolinensis]|nr:hypothetical protein NC652_017807 [Populus alba x Populus x berolinensis]